MSGPHKPWAGEDHAPALLARVRRLLTLDQTSRESIALGMPLSVSMISKMERTGVGSEHAWRALAQVLGEPVERIRPALSPARGNFAEPQLALPGTSS
jgi:hypothetical protein